MVGLLQQIGKEIHELFPLLRSPVPPMHAEGTLRHFRELEAGKDDFLELSQPLSLLVRGLQYRIPQNVQDLVNRRLDLGRRSFLGEGQGRKNHGAYAVKDQDLSHPTHILPSP